MKKTTKVISLLLAGCMLVGMTSCGDKEVKRVEGIPLEYTLTKADAKKYDD